MSTLSFLLFYFHYLWITSLCNMVYFTKFTRIPKYDECKVTIILDIFYDYIVLAWILKYLEVSFSYLHIHPQKISSSNFPNFFSQGWAIHQHI